VDFVAFNDLVEQIRIGETGFAFILNREGKLQTQTPFEISRTGCPFLEWVEGGKSFETEVCIEESKVGDHYLNVGGYLKNDDWLLVFRQRTSDAFSDYWRAVKVTVGILFLGTLGIGIMAFVLSKRIIGRIAEVDREKDLMNEQIIETGKLASVGELAAGIAHEINNPVAIMVEEAGWIEDLLEEEDLKEGENLTEFQRALRQIRSQGGRCKDITHKLLSFARKTDSRVLEVDLNELVREVVSLSEQRAKFANVTIRSNLHPNLPVLQASPSEIQQLLLNLINNAMDAMEKKGGTIDITTGLDGRNVLLEVSDTGKGIAEANLSRLFDPFFTTKPVGKGTGLGLSICYGIIKKLGGDIAVESQVDEGTTFHVSIPYR
jgi:two-component system NtrC family sensor kinase